MGTFFSCLSNFRPLAQLGYQQLLRHEGGKGNGVSPPTANLGAFDMNKSYTKLHTTFKLFKFSDHEGIDVQEVRLHYWVDIYSATSTGPLGPAQRAGTIAASSASLCHSYRIPNCCRACWT